MKTVLSILLLAIFSLGTGSLFGQTTGPTRYTNYSYMKVTPEKYGEYIKLEKAWKKLHMALKKAGKLDDWSLTEVISPSGSSTQYNFVTRNTYLGEAQYASTFDQNYMPENWQSMLTVDEIDLVLRTGEIRTLVKNETWVQSDLIWSKDTISKGKVVVFNYFSIPEGKTNGDHTKVERDIWKPVHQARIKAGTMRGWVLLDMMLPFGSAYPYSSATIDVYNDMKQYLMQDGMEDTFKKVHPGKDINVLWKQTSDACKLVRGEVRVVLDRLSWK